MSLGSMWQCLPSPTRSLSTRETSCGNGQTTQYGVQCIASQRLPVCWKRMACFRPGIPYPTYVPPYVFPLHLDIVPTSIHWRPQDMSMIIDAIPGTWSADQPKKYEPISVKEYAMKRFARNYSGFNISNVSALLSG